MKAHVSDIAHRVSRAQPQLPLLQLAALAGLFLYGSLTVDGYASKRSILAMLVLASFLGVAAGGQTLCVLLGGMDLSIPAVIGAANIMTAQLSGQGWNFVAVVALTLGLALVFGAANGYVAHRFDVPPLIVTLGTGAALAGGVLVWTQGNFTGAAPGWLSRFVSPAQSTFGLPVPPVVVFWLVFAIVIIIILHRTPIGMRFYATGSNQTAADLSLVATRRIWLGGYAASAVCAAMAGMLLAGFSGQGLYNIGDPYLFLTVAAVVVGGTSLLGARGDYARTILGVLILIQLSTLLVSRGPAFTRIVTGVAILAVVTIYGREPHVRLRI